jgi:hypothetical protein
MVAATLALPPQTQCVRHDPCTPSQLLQVTLVQPPVLASRLYTRTRYRLGTARIACVQVRILWKGMRGDAQQHINLGTDAAYASPQQRIN